MAITVLRKVDSYDYPLVKAQIYNLLDSLGAKDKILPNQQVVIKANLLSKKQPEDGVTTHPAVIRGVAEYIIGLGAQPIIADSPGGPFTEGALKGIYGATGMAEVATLTGAKLNEDTSHQLVKLKDFRALEEIDMINVVLQADAIINVAKLKTHVMMTYTGAVKNLYGAIAGLSKAAYHMKLQEPQHFANHLIDICQKVKPVFSLIDGIEAMEGDGPSNGVKRFLGMLLGSENPYELDYVACKIIGFEPEEVATIVEQKKRNLLQEQEIELDFFGEKIASSELDQAIMELAVKPFEKPKTQSVNFIHGKVSTFIERFLIKQTKSKPVFVKQRCIGCGKCAQNCPAKIISIQDKKAQTDLVGCISCFCCHEICPVDAIDIKIPLLAKLIFGEKRRS